MSVVADWTTNAQKDMVAEFNKKTGEPWPTQHFVTTYGDMWIFKAALEAAGKPDRAAVAKALRKMDLTDGPAKYFPGGRVKFDENGRRVGASLLIVQWQNGIPVTVYPPKDAVAEPMWPKR
jgi:branched-chain amino acid transport system substrate-binding protein